MAAAAIGHRTVVDAMRIFQLGDNMKMTRCLDHLGRCLIGVGLGLVLPLSAVAGGAPATASSAVQGSPANPRQQFAAMEVPFIKNQGQVDKRVAFYARTFAGTAFVTRAGALVLSLPGKPTPAAAPAAGEARSAGRGWVLSEIPVSRVPLRPQGDTASPTQVAVFQGRDPRHWQSDLPTFEAVNLGQPWPGIGYAIRAHGDNVERVFTVAPGANARAIRMRIRGAKRLALEHGRLIVATGNGPVTLTRPAAYQLVDGKRRPVRVAYVLHRHRYGFRLGRYDHARPVVIDPLVQATYLGGSGFDFDFSGSLLAFGGNGQVYVVGTTSSTDFPGTTGGAQPVATSRDGRIPAELVDRRQAVPAADRYSEEATRKRAEKQLTAIETVNGKRRQGWISCTPWHQGNVTLLKRHPRGAI